MNNQSRRHNRECNFGIECNKSECKYEHPEGRDERMNNKKRANEILRIMKEEEETE